MRLDSDLLARATAADLLGMYKLGPETLFKVFEEEILHRMEKGGGLRAALIEDLGGISGPAPAPAPKKRKVSAKGRKNMSIAQKKRWAEKRQVESPKIGRLFNKLEKGKKDPTRKHGKG